jgi:hypothetical protein
LRQKKRGYSFTPFYLQRKKVPYFAGDEFALKIGKELGYFASWAISRDPFQ